MLRGFLKKLLIADNLGTFVDPVFADPQANGPATLALATVAFSFQIYCDFSGYSDIAIGTGRILGYDLMENFRRPYLARSIPEFWRRWHISLSTWFRDYVYVSLGGNRVSASRLRWNLFIVFALSGLWHGADWTFVAWGAFHGVLMIAWITLGRYSLPVSPRVARVLGVGVTCVLVCVGWVFFRAESIGDAWYVLGRLGSFDAWSVAEIVTTVDRLSSQVRVAFAACAIMTASHVIEELRGSSSVWASAPPAARWLVYQAGVVALLLFGHFTEEPFMYFQF